MDETLARGPVPRERSVTLGMARDRPSPYGEGAAFFPVARGPVPRDRCMARGTRSHARVACEGPRPTVKAADCYRGD